ncbi:response regulator [Candidatus Parcubacteria bacterium]|nr:response regulator [Candidatus Parcubacteria bacterium]
MENKKKKILILEDDKFLLKAYEIKFEQSDLDVILATDGISGFELAEKEKPSLIILDLMLPRMNGFEFLKKIKSDEKLKNIPVIVISVLGQKVDQERAIKLGAEKYFIKTDYTLEEIIKNLKNILTTTAYGK